LWAKKLGFDNWTHETGWAYLHVGTPKNPEHAHSPDSLNIHYAATVTNRYHVAYESMRECNINKQINTVDFRGHALVVSWILFFPVVL